MSRQHEPRGAATSAGSFRRRGAVRAVHIDVTPEAFAFAGSHESETKPEIDPGFAAFLEGAQA